MAIAADSAVVVGDGRTLRTPARSRFPSPVAPARADRGRRPSAARCRSGMRTGRPLRIDPRTPPGPGLVSFSPDGHTDRDAQSPRREWHGSGTRAPASSEVSDARAPPPRSPRRAVQPRRVSARHRELRPRRTDLGRRDRRAATVLRGHFKVVSDAEFSPDGRWVVTAGPKTAASGTPLRPARVLPPGRPDRLTSATFDPSSGRIVTASEDGTVRAYRCDVCGGLDSLVALAKSRLASRLATLVACPSSAPRPRTGRPATSRRRSRSSPRGLRAGERYQTLLGATGTGKTATMAWIIEKLQRPALVIAHNKTLAAQLCNEFREFFPDERGRVLRLLLRLLPARGVRPAGRPLHREGLVPQRRHRPAAATPPPSSLLTRRDVVIVASVSCIYGLGSPEEYAKRVV